MTTDRFGVTILDRADCWELLGQAEVGRIAVSIRDRPYIFPLNFVVDDETIVFRTAQGTKLAAAVAGRPVVFEVDGYDSGAGQAWSVVVEGRAFEIEHMHEFFDALALPLFPWHAGPKHHFVRIEPDEVSGRRFQVVDKSAWTIEPRTV
jgi:nitroimidazol reductase NimA-like FMN-containing flavoprotein (pyridoxamine 5'-phosphate oxidase superfamily)